jgi:nitrite reductase/ring-hydroxylating ferredoxin subunit/uncharacterized membrane protein
VRSRAHFKAHPLHPALIPFPFAFLVAAPLFDLLGLAQQRPALQWTAGHLSIAGLCAGVVAAVPGVIDYLYTVPPQSSGRMRATRHGLINVVALVAVGVGFLLRADDWSATVATLACEIAAAVALGYSGWLGGTLISRNMISVDHRYANAGKWQEAEFTAKKGQPVQVASVEDLKDDQMKLIRVNGHRLVLAKTAGAWRVFDDHCTHRGGSLAGGVLVHGTVQCLWHGSQFDTATGEVRCGPAKQTISVYAVEQTKDGRVLLVSPPE